MRPISDIDKMIDECVMSLINESPEKAAEALEELARVCRSSKEMFEDLRKLVITTAISKTSKAFVKEKLIISERKLREQRDNANG